ncbi:hypothetical protein TNCV_2565521 [Trichonephila clavipes]|uniref:Uncharacterized protein n=1 Tax=Trichonephila clavipes TaxID=2585209 RepID=A0A8X6VKF7_TRICX|nr:hypothetical protein TNCV_2565521 [Trichonephila clavipes]
MALQYCCSNRSRYSDRLQNMESEGNKERHSESQRAPFTSSPEDGHVTRMTLMDHAATPRALSQGLRSFTRQVSARTIQ